MPSLHRTGVVGRLVAGGLFPPKGVTLLRRDETPDARGILLFEADNPVQAVEMPALWPAAAAGFFSLAKTAPAITITGTP